MGIISNFGSKNISTRPASPKEAVDQILSGEESNNQVIQQSQKMEIDELNLSLSDDTITSEIDYNNIELKAKTHIEAFEETKIKIQQELDKTQKEYNEGIQMAASNMDPGKDLSEIKQRIDNLYQDLSLCDYFIKQYQDYIDQIPYLKLTQNSDYNSVVSNIDIKSIENLSIEELQNDYSNEVHINNNLDELIQYAETKTY